MRKQRPPPTNAALSETSAARVGRIMKSQAPRSGDDREGDRDGLQQQSLPLPHAVTPGPRTSGCRSGLDRHRALCSQAGAAASQGRLGASGLCQAARGSRASLPSLVRPRGSGTGDRDRQPPGAPWPARAPPTGAADALGPRGHVRASGGPGRRSHRPPGRGAWR